MRVRLTISLLVLLAAGSVWLTLASAEPVPATISFEFTQQRPVAGHFFNGLVILEAGGASGFSASCGQAFVGRKQLPEQQHSFFKDSERNAVVCAWLVPKGDAGRALRIVGASGGDNTEGVTGPYPTVSWHIR